MPISYKCDECRHEFSFDLGDEDGKFVIYRCDECDKILKAEKGAATSEYLDQPCQCGGTFFRGRPPKCPNCRSSHVTKK